MVGSSSDRDAQGAVGASTGTATLSFLCNGGTKRPSLRLRNADRTTSTQDFCRDSTLPVCNVRSPSSSRALFHPNLGAINYQSNDMFSCSSIAHNPSRRAVSYSVTKLEMGVYEI